MFNFQIQSKKGLAAFLLTIIITTVIFGIAVSLSILSYGETKIGQNVRQSNVAYFIAEAGIEDAIYRIKKFMLAPPNYTITAGNDSVDVVVSSPSRNNWVITANGNSGNAFRKLEVNLTLSTVNPEFFYGAQAGELGIVMENNSEIQGAGGSAGNVYSNGPIDGDAGSKITGDVFVATGMEEDQTHTVFNEEQIFGKENPVIDLAQSFIPSVSDKLVKASVYIKRIDDPGNRTVRILTDSAGSPSKTSLASAILQESLVGTSYGWVDVVFPSPPNLTAGTTYWLMIDASRDSDDYWSWGKDKNQGYGNGQGKYSQDWNAAIPSWAAITGDLNFKTFMGGQQTSLEGVIVTGDAHANTITNSQICGDAYYQTIDGTSLNFLDDPSNPTCSDPLTPGTAFSGSPDPPLQNMPISESNINQWKKEATDGGVSSGDLVVSSNMSYGPQKIVGNLLLTSNNKILTVTGTIYVTGYIDISNGSAIQCAASYGLNSCVVIADKWVHLENNGVFQGSGEEESYLMILSASNCDGSSSIGCTHHNAAMDIHNNAAGAIFYANDGLVYLHNGVVVSEITAKKIQLNQNAIIRYEQGLAYASFSSGPGASWGINSWKETD